jgi:tetratricopeptide (TPR) repeat protein
MFKKATAVFAALVITGALFTACSGNAAKVKSPSSGISGSSATSAPQSSSGASSAQSLSSAPSSSYANPDADPLYAKAYGDYAANKFDDAVAVCDQALAKDPNCFWAYNVKGLSIYFANGNTVADECIALIDKSLAIDPEYSFGYFNKARILKGLKRWDESIDCFNESIKYDTSSTSSAWAYYGIATIYADTNQIDLALEFLKKSIDLNSDCKEQAKTEGHFDKYHDNAQFQALVGS